MRANFGASGTMENVKTNYLDARVGVNDGGVALEHGNTTM
jgi:ferric-dicitrate binding protein FerR (iron transport regulator)